MRALGMPVARGLHFVLTHTQKGRMKLSSPAHSSSLVPTLADLEAPWSGQERRGF